MNRGNDVIKKGFTLIEALMGLALLGLISIMILPIVNSSFIILNNHNLKLEMMYVGEMVVEKIKAFEIDISSSTTIYDTEVSEIIDLFKSKDKIEIIIPKKENSEKYLIKIIKNNKSKDLWMMNVYVYQNKKSRGINHVEYKTYLPQK